MARRVESPDHGHSTIPLWVRSAVSILLISCRNVRPYPVSFGGSRPNTWSTCSVRSRSMRRIRSCPIVGKLSTPRFVYDLRDFVEVVRRLKEDYKTR